MNGGTRKGLMGRGRTRADLFRHFSGGVALPQHWRQICQHSSRRRCELLANGPARR
jgi:hypothetical protein